MLRPVPMTRALIVGPREELEGTIERLYDLKLLHIVDHKEGEEGLEIGRPLRKASEASEILVKLRSLASVLQIEEAEPAAQAGLEGDLRQKILSLELNISEEDASKKKIQALLADLDRQIEEMTPFAQLPLALEDYRGYERLEVFVGKIPRDIEDLDTVTREYEAFAAPGLLAVFVAKAAAPAMRDFLAQRGFTNLPLPEGDGRPSDLLAGLRAEKERWETRFQEIEERLSTLRERYAGFLVAAKAHLETQVEKAEAPLRFAVTDHTFLVDGWVPTAVFPEMKERLERESHLLVSELEVAAGHAEPAVEPPVELRNPRPIRPFEMLIHMFGTPSYHELDPTLVFSLAFPVMFGIMVGDLGYGVVWVVYGLWLLRRWKDKPWGFWKNLTVAFVWGGLWASIFGAFVFGEAFGIPFHAPNIVGISRDRLHPPRDRIHVRCRERGPPQPETRGREGGMAPHPHRPLLRHHGPRGPLARHPGLRDLERRPRLGPAGGLGPSELWLHGNEPDPVRRARDARCGTGHDARHGRVPAHHGDLRPPGERRVVRAAGGHRRGGGDRDLRPELPRVDLLPVSLDRLRERHRPRGRPRDRGSRKLPLVHPQHDFGRDPIRSS